MKLLLFSDLHSDRKAARRLAERAPGFDVLIGAGDFCNAHSGLQKCLDEFRDVKVPMVLVAGNNERTEDLARACRDWANVHVLHGNGVTIGGLTFFGIGGGIPVTPFGAWSYDFTEEQAEDLLAACTEADVLVSHSPPKGLVDMSSSGKSLGSVAVRAAVQRLRPRLVVCGHIHGSAAMSEQVGDTVVINAGPVGVKWED